MVKPKKSSKIAYMLFEGETEEVFYQRVFSKYLYGVPQKIDCLNGNLGINNKIIKRLSYFINCNSSYNDIYVYVFLDRESYKAQKPDFNPTAIIKKLNSKYVNKIIKVEAVLMIESWFFYDIESICGYIGITPTKSLLSRYNNPERLTANDLSDLFRKGTSKKYYRKGDESFQKILDIEKIYLGCSDLKSGIEKIINDFTF